MRILAIDGTGPIAVAAWENGSIGGPQILATAARAERQDADHLPAAVARCLSDAGWTPQGWDLLACSVGPGSFTAIRVCVAMARGLALAAGRPVLPVSRFEAIAARARREGIAGPLHVLIDAGRSGWFSQDRPDEDEAGPPLSRPVLPDDDGTRILVGSGENVHGIIADATDVACVAANRLARGERAVSGLELTPLYLREADARVGAGRSLLSPAGGPGWR